MEPNNKQTYTITGDILPRYKEIPENFAGLGLFRHCLETIIHLRHTWAFSVAIRRRSNVSMIVGPP